MLRGAVAYAAPGFLSAPSGFHQRTTSLRGRSYGGMMDPDGALRGLRDMELGNASQDERSELRNERLDELLAQAEAMPASLEREQTRGSLLMSKQLETIGRANRNLTAACRALQIVVVDLAERVNALERAAGDDEGLDPAE